MSNAQTTDPEATAALREEFALRGVVRIPGFLPAQRVQAARERVHNTFAKVGIRSEQGETTATDIDHARVTREVKKSLKQNVALAALAGPETHQLASALAGESLVGMAPGAQLLFTLPGPGNWTVPATIWHVDYPRMADNLAPGVQLFTFLEPVAPGGGGTLVVAGSHRLLNSGQFIRSKHIKRRLKQYPYFQALLAKQDNGDRARFLAEPGHAEGVELQVVELTGEPGDIYLVDLRLLHTLAPNVNATPRVMLTERYVREACQDALMAEFGWDPPRT